MAAFLCFYNLGYASFGAGDQTIHARVVAETVASGDYLHPSYKGGPYHNKPPFKLWLTMFTVKYFGSSNLSFRIWDGISGFCTMMLLYFFATKIYRSAVAGFFAVSSLCGAMIFFYGHGSRNGVQDSMMLALMTLATILGWEFIQESKRSDYSNSRLWRLSVAGGLAIGLGLLTKNVPAYYALVILGLLALFTGDALALVKNHWGKLLTIFVISALPMAIYLLARGEDRVMAIHMLFNVEIVKRATNGFNFKREKLFYFNIIFRNGELVAPITLAWGIGVAMFQAIRRRSAVAMLALIWGIAPVLIQSAAKAKAEWYIMPALPGMALLAAGGIWFTICWLQSVVSEYRSGTSRASELVLPLIITALISIPISTHVAYVAEYTITRNRKNDADLVTSSLKSHQRRLGRPLRIVAYDYPRLADHEILYWQLISGPPVELSFEHLKEQLLSENPPDIVLTRTRSEPAIREILAPSSSADFPPRDKRRRRLVVLSYLEDFTPNLLDPNRLPTKGEND